MISQAEAIRYRSRRRRWDHLLDVFSVWRRRPTALARMRLLRAAALVAEVDPTFSRVRFVHRWCTPVPSGR